MLRLSGMDVVTARNFKAGNVQTAGASLQCFSVGYPISSSLDLQSGRWFLISDAGRWLIMTLRSSEKMIVSGCAGEPPAIIEGLKHAKMLTVSPGECSIISFYEPPAPWCVMRWIVGHRSTRPFICRFFVKY